MEEVGIELTAEFHQRHLSLRRTGTFLPSAPISVQIGRLNAQYSVLSPHWWDSGEFGLLIIATFRNVHLLVWGGTAATLINNLATGTLPLGTSLSLPCSHLIISWELLQEIGPPVKLLDRLKIVHLGLGHLQLFRRDSYQESHFPMWALSQVPSSRTCSLEYSHYTTLVLQLRV